MRSVFERTVEWAIEHGIETATFHILTPYPGTALHQRLVAQGRITTADWDLYDTRHAVFRPAQHDGASSSKPATGAPIATSIAGASIARGACGARRARSQGYATSPMRPAGRSSSRCGISSFARSAPA